MPLEQGKDKKCQQRLEKKAASLDTAAQKWVVLLMPDDFCLIAEPNGNGS